jgi:hypothetical protein
MPVVAAWAADIISTSRIQLNMTGFFLINSPW